MHTSLTFNELGVITCRVVCVGRAVCFGKKAVVGAAKKATGSLVFF